MAKCLALEWGNVKKMDRSTKDCRQSKSLLLLLSFCWHFLHIKMMNLIIVSFRYICQVTWMIILFNLIRLPKLDPCVSTIKILTKNANSCLTQIILFWCFLTDTYINDSKPPFPNYIYIHMLNHTKVTLFVSNCLRKFSF